MREAQRSPHTVGNCVGILDVAHLTCREPAKFVAKLREHKTDKHMLLFKCDLGAGHFSQSGRFDRLKDTALEYAFLLKCQDLVDT